MAQHHNRGKRLIAAQLIWARDPALGSPAPTRRLPVAGTPLPGSLLAGCWRPVCSRQMRRHGRFLPFSCVIKDPGDPLFFLPQSSDANGDYQGSGCCHQEPWSVSAPSLGNMELVTHWLMKAGEQSRVSCCRFGDGGIWALKRHLSHVVFHI